MKKSLLIAFFALLASGSAFASSPFEYTCFPGHKNSNQSKYLLKVSANKIELGYHPDNLKSAQKVKNESQNWLSAFSLYDGQINDLVGDGHLEAFLAPELSTGGNDLRNGGKGGQMVLAWSGAGPTRLDSFLCVAQ